MQRLIENAEIQDDLIPSSAHTQLHISPPVVRELGIFSPPEQVHRAPPLLGVFWGLFSLPAAMSAGGKPRASVLLPALAALPHK